MNNLEKELNERAKAAQTANNDILSDVKLLLESNAAEEINTLRSIGLDFDINLAYKKKTDNVIREAAGKKLDRTILHVSELRKFCNDYRLYLKKANHYTGTIPSDLGAELTRFCKEKSIALPSSSSYSKFYIMAPPVMFAGYRSLSDIVLDSYTKVRDDRAERERLRKLDPILLYQLDDKDYFAVIKSWGNDFTINRKISAFLHRKIVVSTVMLLINLLIGYVTYKFVTWQFMKFVSMDAANEVIKQKSAWLVIGIAIGLASIIAYGVWLFLDDAIDFRNNIKEQLTKKGFDV